ncbi:MAG TPA: hypothetical protein VGI75_15140 [Pirellulales bacterium]
MRSFICLFAGLMFVTTQAMAGGRMQPEGETQEIDSAHDGDNAAESTTIVDDHADDHVAPNESTTSDESHNPPITFDGKTLDFVSSSGNADGTSVVEYLPAGQNLEKWTELGAIWVYSEIDDPQRLASVIIDDLKQKSPEAAAHRSDSPNADEPVIDFIAWADDKSYVEFNVWKFRKRDGGGVIGEQYALREYADPQKFVRELGPQRDKLVKEMIADGLQSVAKGSRE